MKDLIALVNPTNSQAIVQSLTPALLDTPFGVAGLDQWAQVDRRAAADWMALQPSSTDAEAAAVTRSWWMDDHDGFQAYCDQLPKGEWKQKVLTAASYEAIAGNPTQAISLAARLSPDDRQVGLLQAATQEWTRQDPKAAMTWLNQITDFNLQEKLIGAAAVGYATVDPAAAATWISRTVKDEDVLRLAVIGIVQTWAIREPVAAGEWIARFPPGKIQDAATETLLRGWRVLDRSAASSWAATLPPGPLRSQASQFIAKNRGR